MEKWQHLPYLLVAYGAAWVGFFGYLVWLGLRQKSLGRRLSDLEKGS